MAVETRDKPRVIITGASGLIGTRLIDRISNHYSCIALDVRPLPEGSKTPWFECDLTNDASTREALKNVKDHYGDTIASVVHLAAYYDFSGEPSPLYQNFTVAGTEGLLKNLQGFHLEQFLFSSSLLVMKAASKGQTLKETSPVEAEWDYPNSKLKAEAVIRDQGGTIPCVILRIAGVYNDRCNSIPIAHQIKRIYEKDLESYFFPGNADHGQAFIHIDDLVECLVKTIDLRGSLDDHELFLIAEPDVLSYGELQNRIGELIHGKEWPTIRIPKTIAKAGAWVKEKVAGQEKTFIKPWMVDLADAHYPVSIERARQKLGWKPEHRLGSTITEMIEFLRRDPRAWHEENDLPMPEHLSAKESKRTGAGA